jgi:hypothetical protein
MASVPSSIRLNDETDLKRAEKMAAHLDRLKVKFPETIRQLVDAWIAYVEEYGHAPGAPVRIEPLRKGRKRSLPQGGTHT